MTSEAKKEYAVLAVLALVLLISILPALRYARREKRDGVRRDALVELKHKLEEANNKLGYYPVTFSATPYQFVVTHGDGKKAIGWYIRTVLENKHADEKGFDFEGNHNFYYRLSSEHGSTFYDICGGDDTCGAPLADNNQP